MNPLASPVSLICQVDALVPVSGPAKSTQSRTWQRTIHSPRHAHHGWYLQLVRGREQSIYSRGWGCVDGGYPWDGGEGGVTWSGGDSGQQLWTGGDGLGTPAKLFHLLGSVVPSLLQRALLLASDTYIHLRRNAPLCPFQAQESRQAWQPPPLRENAGQTVSG